MGEIPFTSLITAEHRSVKASLRDLDSLKEAFTDLAPDRTPRPYPAFSPLDAPLLE